MRRLPLIALTLLAGFLAALAAPALRADHEGVVVPDVAGRTPEEARQAIEAVGLAPLLVPVAGPPPGRVERQEPLAGVRVALGVQVVVRYGIGLRLETRVPDVRRRLLSDVGPELEGAYTVEVELVFAPGGPEGEILEQSPAPGATLWYRGVLALKVTCVKCHAGTVVVPTLVGRTEAEAVELLKSAGLNPVVDYRLEPHQPAGLVSAQDPRSGAELLYGGTVYLRVSGTPPTEPPPVVQIPVPNLVGLDMNVALHTAQASGFLPQLSFQVAHGQAPWSVIAQDPPAGTPRAPGAPLVLGIALSGPAPQQVRMPSLFGLTQPHAVQILSALGLSMQVTVEHVGFPSGRVFSQQPAAGALVLKGATVRFNVSKGPGPQPPPSASVPALDGLSSLEAFLKIQLAGLTPKALQHLAPNHPVDRVDQQSPAPGALVPMGSEVRFFVPLTALVPALQGGTRSQAIALLQAEGFNANPQGPAFGMGSTVVIAQSVPAGAALARGSSVSFAFKFQQGGGMPVKVQVPNLLGGTKQDAVAALQQKGLGVDLDRQGPILPGPGTKVIAQMPPAGALVPPGTVVKVGYVELAGGPQGLTQVPALVGKTLVEAQQLLAAANLGLNAQQQGPNMPGGIKQVISQQPAPGAIVALGLLVQVVYVEQLPLAPQLVTVPTLTGKTRAQAQSILSGLGLTAKFNGAGGNPNKLLVILQAPAAGAKLAPGSQVTMVVVPKP